MNFNISETQQMVAEAAKDFAEKYIRPHVMQWDESQEFPVEVLGFGAIGWNFLKEINFENTGITEIETVGISGCTALENVILPATIKVIGYDAFWYCQHLKTVTINAVTPPTLVNYPFKDTNLQKVYVPKASVEKYKAAPFWKDFAAKIQAKP